MPEQEEHAAPPLLTSLPVHATHPELSPLTSCPSGHTPHASPPVLNSLPVHATHEVPLSSCPGRHCPHAVLLAFATSPGGHA